MPYALQSYYLPEWEREAPASWVRRLGEISEPTDRMAHLRFRYFEPFPHWNYPEQGVWTLYACTPRHLVSADRASLFAKHWSEMATEGERVARRSSVSSYQHFMWHVRGVDAQAFLILQGMFGGTPAKYTRLEKRILDAEGAESDPFPLGVFAPCPFDEQTVERIQERDKFLLAEKSFERMQSEQRPAWQKVLDEEAERAHRVRFLAKWKETIQPQADFLKTFLRTKASHALPRAPEGLNDAVSQFKDHYIEFGHVIGAKVAASRAVRV